MADVRPGRHGQSAERSSRGQLILVTALGLAILFVSLAIIVNTAIYTENLATRGSDIGGGTEAVRYQDAVRSGVGGLIEFANYNENTDHDTLRTELVAGVDAIDNRTGFQFAMSNRAVDTSLNTTVNGTRIAQTDGSRNFSNVSGTADWTVVEDVNHVRQFRMNVSGDDLLGLLSGSFKVTLDDGAVTWNMSLYTDGTEIVLEVDGPSGSGECRENAGSVWVNVTDGTYAGEPCEPLETFADGLSTPYTIQFDNGAEGAGTYTLVVDNETLAGSPGPHLADDGPDQPFATHAIYSANVTATYQTPRLYYDVTVRVAPGEPDG